MNAVRLPRSVLAGVVLITLVRLAIAAVLPLGDDETYYWEWSRHLAPGYLDHPPLIAWLVRLSTTVFGTSAFAVHLVAVTLFGATSLALWALAREVSGRGDAATWAVVLFNVIPVFAAGGLLAAPDGPLGLGWMLTLLWAWRAVHGRSTGAWVAAGVWLGVALDSKYTALLLPVAIALWLALLPEHRAWFRRPEPAAGLAPAALLFAPVVGWNAVHHWASFYFTIAGRPGWSAGPDAPIFLGLQFIYLAPLLFPWLVWALIVAARRGVRGDDAWLFLAAAGIPVIAGAVAASLIGAAKGHWAAPGYITATIALASLITERPWAARPRAWRWGVTGGIASALAVTVLAHALPLVSARLLPARLDPTVDYYGWPAAARAIADVARREAHGPFFIASDRYQVLAQFDFSTRGRFPAASLTGRDEYRYWTPWRRLQGHDALVIQDGRYPLNVNLTMSCGTVERAPSVPIVRGGVIVRTLDLTWCRDFRGRWPR